MNINSMYDLLDKWWDEGKEHTQEYKELEDAVNLAENEKKYKEYNDEEDALWQKRVGDGEMEDFVNTELKGLNKIDPFYDFVFESKFVGEYYAKLA